MVNNPISYYIESIQYLIFSYEKSSSSNLGKLQEDGSIVYVCRNTDSFPMLLILTVLSMKKQRMHRNSYASLKILFPNHLLCNLRFHFYNNIEHLPVHALSRIPFLKILKDHYNACHPLLSFYAQ